MLIEPPLTGERTYLHGADILDALVAATGAESDLGLVLRVAGNCAIEALPGPPDAAACGRFRYRRGGRDHQLVLRHRPDRPIARRLVGDDARLVAGAELECDRATQPAGTPGGILQRAVALALALLERPHPEDYWSIAEIDCRVAPPADGALAVAVQPRLGGRFWRAAVAVDGGPLGTVLLARGQPRR